MKRTIYVQIPAYRDSELPRTIHDLYRKADRPEKIRTVVVWQHGEGESLPRATTSLSNVQIIPFPASSSKGPNWARALLQDNYQGEEFTLFLDSHHRFVRGWDEQLVVMYRRLKKRGVRKPIITAYLPSYDPHREPYGRMCELLKIYPLKREHGMLTRLTGRPLALWKWLKEPIPAHFISLHFLFAEGHFNHEIRFDPEIYFFGDEVLVSLRAFSEGYDMFHPHVIMGWHLYDRATRVPHWDDHQKWSDSNRASYSKMRKIFSGRYDNGYLGNVRSVRDYESYIGTRLIQN